MVLRKEFVILGADSVFQEPESLEAAEQRRLTLRVQLTQLEGQLEQQRAYGDGRRLSGGEYIDWRRTIGQQMNAVGREMKFLKSWITLKTPPPANTLSARQVREESAYRLLWRCHHLLTRLVDEGVDLDDDEVALLAEATEFTGLKTSQLLEEARGCVYGRPESVFQYGTLVAQAVREDEDVDLLTSEWQALTTRSPRDEALIARCSEYYVLVLIFFSRLEEALLVVRSIDQCAPEASMTWLIVGIALGDMGMVERARKLARALPLARRSWFFLSLYQRIGLRVDLEGATQTRMDEATFGKRAEWFRSSLVKALADWGHLGEAREHLRAFTTSDSHLYALASIAKASQEPDDINRLSERFREAVPAKISVMRHVIPILAQHDRGDLVARKLATMSTWYLKCDGYSSLTLALPHRANEMVIRAEQALISAQDTLSGEGSEALLGLVHAQAVSHRRTEALRVLTLIKERGCRCSALLMLYLTSRGEKIPQFLRDAK